ALNDKFSGWFDESLSR
ncbi:hypothetical protein A2U01_0095018, partial [Trifolium medium]|nr:hypothetical protein [Trifolium medium]